VYHHPPIEHNCDRSCLKIPIEIPKLRYRLFYAGGVIRSASEILKMIFFKYFLVDPFGYLCLLSFHLLTQPGLGTGIDPGMSLKPFPSSIG